MTDDASAGAEIDQLLARGRDLWFAADDETRMRAVGMARAGMAQAQALYGFSEGLARLRDPVNRVNAIEITRRTLGDVPGGTDVLAMTMFAIEEEANCAALMLDPIPLLIMWRGVFRDGPPTTAETDALLTMTDAVLDRYGEPR